MRGKLFKHMFLVAMSVFVACTALFMWSLYSYFSEERQGEQREETAYAAAAVEEGGKDFLQTKLPKDSANRITWIDRDGTVLFDSVAKAEDMENHAGRDEVQQAMKTGEGESTRYSSTLSRKTTNYALRLDDGTILRLSGTQYTVVSLLVSQFQALVAVLVLAVGLAAFWPIGCLRASSNPSTTSAWRIRTSGTCIPNCVLWCGASAGRTSRSSTRWKPCARRTSSRTKCAGSSPPTCLTS